jgi:UDP-N-acetylglucosamine 2-epimerase (non-hydrolysing)
MSSFSARRILVVFGTRPEAIKLAPVILALKQDGRFEVTTCSTGQHAHMVAPVCSFFDVAIDHDLAVMQDGQSLHHITSAILCRLPDVFGASRPDLVIVQGDTATAFSASLAAFYAQIDVAHVEAGLRTFDLRSPWPEEGFREMVGRLARFHFAPTDGAYRNLTSEGARGELLVTGNTVVDAARIAAARIRGPLELQIAAKLALSSTDQKKILFTMHRRESFGDPVERVLTAIGDLVLNNDVELLYPVHPNPCVAEPAHRILGSNPKVRLLPPLGYDETIFAIQASSFLVTDSGGLAEEAPTFNKPALILRESTERPECVECGASQLVGYDTGLLKNLAQQLLAGGELYETMSSARNPFGDGFAANRIATCLGGLRQTLAIAA